MKQLLKENVSYFRLNPELEEEIPLDSVDNASLLKLLQISVSYVKANENLIEKIVGYMQ